MEEGYWCLGGEYGRGSNWAKKIHKLQMNEQNCIILNWNVRGLNGKATRKVVKDLVAEHKCTIVCLQETKMEFIDDMMVKETLGPQFATSFTYLPAQATRGGVLLAMHEDYYKLSHPQHRINSHCKVRSQDNTNQLVVDWGIWTTK